MEIDLTSAAGQLFYHNPTYFDLDIIRRITEDHNVHVYKIHAYEMHAREIHVHDVHTHEMHAVRYTPMRCISVRYTPMRYTHEAYACEVHAREAVVRVGKPGPDPKAYAGPPIGPVLEAH
jgi:hypothetical protein